MLSFVTCKKDIPVEPITAQSNVSKKELLCNTWRLVQEISGSDVEPFGPDTINYSIESKPVRIWKIHNDSTYIIYTRVNDVTSSDDRMNIEKGYWAFNENSTIIGRIVYEANGQHIESSTMSFRENIVELTETKLTIRFRGRAGNVYQKYTPFADTDTKKD